LQPARKPSVRSDFVGHFACAAWSGAPVLLLEVVAQGRYVDVTRQFMVRISIDARRWWTRSGSAPADTLGTLAARAADECELGQRSRALSTLGQMAAAGKPGPSGAKATAGPYPTGRAYVAALRSFLHKEGYCS
jgi:hypothetical protein